MGESFGDFQSHGEPTKPVNSTAQGQEKPRKAKNGSEYTQALLGELHFIITPVLLHFMTPRILLHSVT